MAVERFVLCIKWGNAFVPDYVNVLHNACRRAMRGPFRFVCLTDDPTGLAPGIETFSIPEIGLEAAEWYRRGAWPKLGLFDDAMHGLRGRALFIDLDMVVLTDLDAFFEDKRSFIGIDAGRAWGTRGSAFHSELGTGIIAFDIGAHPEVPRRFRAEKSTALAEFQNEQQFVQNTIRSVDYWPLGWVISFKRELRRPILADIFLAPYRPGRGTKVIAFHGKPRPIDLITGRPRFWDRFPHMGNGRVGWMADYWAENGGRSFGP